MPKYRIHKAAFLQSGRSPKQMHAAGAVVEFDGVPNVGWQPLDDEAKAAIERRLAESPFTVAKNGVQAIDSRTGQPRVFTTPLKPIHPEQPLVGNILNAG